jgi:uncharacterized protein YodC (DUF2158 family)
MTNAQDTQDKSPLRMGDVVSLNSGGSRMTVVDCREGNTHVLVTWEYDGNIHHHEFPSVCVYRVKQG